ncbi:hypothetical protein N7539_002457 [Penicillium diatomitis]|uniref:Uncharacterized protein n=1 Tax=Penicillium diatomitis TaxID=2819901 RepID=A0A9W9XEP6_9EURO|nr:uncharacterized protein N7539_002457 [Penicillium diatomitis]KAJ5490890.1 hypothetical protein N7539_002457 [Penicillium diatomitis]
MGQRKDRLAAALLAELAERQLISERDAALQIECDGGQINPLCRIETGNNDGRFIARKLEPPIYAG